PSLTIDGAENFSHFGASLVGLDANGDGYADLAVGAPDRDVGGVDRGFVLLYLGSGSGLSTTSSATLRGGWQNNAHFGFALAAGDTDADGKDDLVVSAKDMDFGQTDEGLIYLYHGTDGRDRDGDGVDDLSDNCETIYNPTQQDTDSAK